MPTFEQAIALPQASYLTVQEAGVGLEQMVSADLDCAVISNKTSLRPVPCTKECLQECLGIAIENKATGALSVAHVSQGYYQALYEMIGLIRRNRADKLNIHLLGAVKWGSQQHLWKEMMNELLKIIDQTPNTELCTFDVGNKPHPATFAIAHINAETRLIRGSEDMPLFDKGMLGQSKEHRNQYTMMMNRLKDTNALKTVFQPPPIRDQISDTVLAVSWDGRLPAHQAHRQALPAGASRDEGFQIQ